MKKHKIVTALLSTLFVSILSITLIAMGSYKVIGNGNIIKTTREVSDFNELILEGAGLLLIHQGDRESLVITTDENVEPHIQSVVSGKTFKIGPQKSNRLKPSQTIQYTLYLQDLQTLKIRGSMEIKSDSLKTDQLDIGITGSGSIVFKEVMASSLSFSVKGSGEITIESGVSINQKITVSGSSTFNLADLKSENAEISIKGSGKTTLWTTKTLNVDIKGSGKVYYYGAPETNINVAGSGKVKGLGAK